MTLGSEISKVFFLCANVFEVEVKIHIIFFACDIEGDSSLLIYVGGTYYGS